MDGKTDEGKSQNSEAAGEAGAGRRKLTAADEVAAARERFLEASETFAPLGPIRRHPFLSVGGAFAAGFGISGLVKSDKLLPLLPVGAQLAALTAKLGLMAMDRSTNRRS